MKKLVNALVKRSKYLMKDKFFVLVTLVLMAVGLFFYVDYRPNRITPAAQKGVLNAEHWNLAKQGVVPPVGMWAYYPSQLLQPQEIRALAHPRMHTSQA